MFWACSSKPSAEVNLFLALITMAGLDLHHAAGEHRQAQRRGEPPPCPGEHQALADGDQPRDRPPLGRPGWAQRRVSRGSMHRG